MAMGLVGNTRNFAVGDLTKERMWTCSLHSSEQKHFFVKSNCSQCYTCFRRLFRDLR